MSTIYLNLLTQLNKLFRHNRQGSYKTRERYFEAMKRFCRFLADEYRLEKLSNISSKHLESYTMYMKEKGLSPSTIKTDFAAIRFWHDQIPRPRFKLPDNSKLGLERRRFGGVERAWSQSEFSKFIALCWKHNREDYATVACLAYYSGLRIHECFRIDTAIAQQAVKTMEITITGKNGKVRTVPINESIRIELEKMLAVTSRGHKLFVPQDSQTHSEIAKLQKFIIDHRDEFQSDDSPISKSFHGQRHSFAKETYSSLINSGHTDLEARQKASKLLGHNRLDVTAIYITSQSGEDGSHG